MTVTVTLNDGSQIFPAFDPEHRDGVTAFYAEAKSNGTIRDYEIA